MERSVIRGTDDIAIPDSISFHPGYSLILTSYGIKDIFSRPDTRHCYIFDFHPFCCLSVIILKVIFLPAVIDAMIVMAILHSGRPGF